MMVFILAHEVPGAIAPVCAIGYTGPMRIYLWAMFVLFLVMVGNIVGITNHLYVSIDSYDIFMHIAGGLGIGLFVAAALELHAPGVLRTRSMVIGAVLAAGIAWELFEVYYGIAGAPLGTKAYWVDTIKDLIDDTLGGFVVAFVHARFRMR